MKSLVLVVILLGLGSLAGLAETEAAPARKVDPKEYSAGEVDAQRDIKQGKVVYEILGEPSMIDNELRKIALKDYGITVKFRGCVAGPRIDYDRGYLDAVISFLKKKYSFDPVVKVERELREKESGTKLESDESKVEAQPKPEAAPR